MLPCQLIREPITFVASTRLVLLIIRQTHSIEFDFVQLLHNDLSLSGTQNYVRFDRLVYVIVRCYCVCIGQYLLDCLVGFY
jgi:hypothetical protein